MQINHVYQYQSWLLSGTSCDVSVAREISQKSSEAKKLNLISSVLQLTYLVHWNFMVATAGNEIFRWRGHRILSGTPYSAAELLDLLGESVTPCSTTWRNWSLTYELPGVSSDDIFCTVLSNNAERNYDDVIMSHIRIFGEAQYFISRSP